MRGTKRQRGPGVWELRVYLGRNPHTGSPIQRSRTVHGTESDAEAVLRRMLVDLEHVRGPVGTVTTIKELADEWVAHLRAVGRANATLDGYESKLRLHVLPALGRRKVDRVTALDLDRLYGEMAGKGLVRSIPQVHAVVRSMLGQAVKWDLVTRNVAQRATLPRVPSLPPWAPPEETAVAFLQAVAELDPDLGAYLLLTADLGARRSEPLALRWPDVRWEEREVEVSHAVEFTSVQRKAGVGPQVKPTKTHAQGVIPVGVDTVLALEGVRERQRAQVVDAGVVPARDAFVFADLARDLRGTVPWRPDRVTGAVRRHRVRPELAALPEVEKVTVKSLRHFMVTSLAARGMVAEAMKRARHRNITTTQRYMSVVEARQRASADVMAEVLRFPGTPDPSAIPSQSK
jgi:integrase